MRTFGVIFLVVKSLATFSKSGHVFERVHCCEPSVTCGEGFSCLVENVSHLRGALGLGDVVMSREGASGAGDAKAQYGLVGAALSI